MSREGDDAVFSQGREFPVKVLSTLGTNIDKLIGGGEGGWRNARMLEGSLEVVDRDKIR